MTSLRERMAQHGFESNDERDVRTGEPLRQSIYGWIEGVDRELLYSAETEPAIEAVVQEIRDYVGVDEVELVAHTAVPVHRS
jgi:hypothetical protein